MFLLSKSKFYAYFLLLKVNYWIFFTLQSKILVVFLPSASGDVLSVSLFFVFFTLITKKITKFANYTIIERG